MIMKAASVLNFIITPQKFTRRNRGIWNSGKPYKHTIRILIKVLTLYGFFTAQAHVQVSWENLKESTRKTKR